MKETSLQAIIDENLDEAYKSAAKGNICRTENYVNSIKFLADACNYKLKKEELKGIHSALVASYVNCITKNLDNAIKNAKKGYEELAYEYQEIAVSHSLLLCDLKPKRKCLNQITDLFFNKSSGIEKSLLIRKGYNLSSDTEQSYVLRKIIFPLYYNNKNEISKKQIQRMHTHLDFTSKEIITKSGNPVVVVTALKKFYLK